MKFYSLLLSCLTFLFFAAPAYAGKLMFWRFEQNQNRLIFSTDQGVQPTAQLISNPTRLVIDLPGTILGRPTVNENFSGLITSLRIGQFDARTTRLVVELAPGYTLDPQKIQIKGISPTQWTVDLPNPERGTLTSPDSSNDSPYNRSRLNSTPINTTPHSTLVSDRSNKRYNTINANNANNTSNNSSNNLPSRSNYNNNSNSGLKLTSSGIVIGLDGDNQNNKITINRSRDRKQVEIELENMTLPSDLPKLWSVNQYGISDIEIKQTNSDRATAMIVLNVDRDSPDWQASFSRTGGLVLWPQGGISRLAQSSENVEVQPQPKTEPSSSKTVASERNAENNNNNNSRVNRANVNGKTSVESIELARNQLVVRGNQKIDAQGSWNPRSGVYQLRINNADLSPNFKAPQLPVGSPISRMRIWQPDGNTVILLLQPALGARFNQLNQPSEQMLSLSVTQYSSSQARSNNNSSLSISVTPPPPSTRQTSSAYMNPHNVTPSNSRNWQSNNTRSPRKSRTLIVIDPGHGGKDPGAVGIGGVQEKHVVMAISNEVARILEQNGIQVKMTRTNDYFISLQGRTDLANRIDADLFVSIHANSAGMNKPQVSGFEIFYFQSGRNLAATIHRNVIRQVNVRDRKVKKARFYVLRKSAMPAVLAEVGFLTGTEDAAKLRNPRYQKQMAQAIASGIIEYVKANGL